jgi:hypothetical protein
MNSLTSLTPQQLRQAAEIKDRIQELEAELSQILDGSSPRGPGRPPKRHMSASARERIAAAQRARWAKQRGSAPANSGKPKRKMSPAARKKLAAVAKARWAKVKAAGKSAL